MKINDEVMIIRCDSINSNKKGDIGIITEYHYNDIFRVKVNGRDDYCNWHQKYDLELIKSN